MAVEALYISNVVTDLTNGTVYLFLVVPYDVLKNTLAIHPPGSIRHCKTNSYVLSFI